MKVIDFPACLTPAAEGGVTHAQAMEVHRRFCERLQAVPTIAHEMGIGYEAACQALDGVIWPGAHRYWVDRVLP